MWSNLCCSHLQEEILNVEFSKLQNLDTVKSAADADTPLELSLLSKSGAQVSFVFGCVNRF